jgi:hypothetical protein
LVIAGFSKDLAFEEGELIGAYNQGVAITRGNRFRLFAGNECRQLLRVVDVGRFVDTRRYGLVIVEEAIEQVLAVD